NGIAQTCNIISGDVILLCHANPAKSGVPLIRANSPGASISLVTWGLLVQNAPMTRRFCCLILALAAAGCAAPKAPPVPSASAIPPAPRRGEPGQYLNMPVSGLQAAFGKPAFVRKDGATEMWRYDGQSCRAFFFLYGSPL